MKKALVINPNGTMFTTEFPDKNTGDEIRRLVGNWFDCVREDDFVGYVDDEGHALVPGSQDFGDEGLLNGSDLNLVASIVFGRYLAGVVVVFGCLNENGIYDGRNYDITPDALLRFAWCAEAKKTHEREIALRSEI